MLMLVCTFFSVRGGTCVSLKPPHKHNEYGATVTTATFSCLFARWRPRLRQTTSRGGGTSASNRSQRR
uniref:Putative secreted protein n=1 Tax=Anopheles triannulatus TaxID=58253 RepID=A0A2M4B565_9DIPT